MPRAGKRSVRLAVRDWLGPPAVCHAAGPNWASRTAGRRRRIVLPQALEARARAALLAVRVGYCARCESGLGDDGDRDFQALGPHR